jgi:hypothetical protein
MQTIFDANYNPTTALPGQPVDFYPVPFYLKEAGLCVLKIRKNIRQHTVN